MDRQVALYWDFENIHAAVCTIQFGDGWYRQHRLTRQENVVNIDAIMQYVAGIGDVNINKAYSDWGFLQKYSPELQNHAVDLIQLFPRGTNSKNGADIRMAIDVIEDITLNPHICTVVIVGGDSDYIPVAQRVRQKGRSIIGIGARCSTNQYLIKACNEFKFYSSLLLKSADGGDLKRDPPDGSDLEDVRLCRVQGQVGRILAPTRRSIH